MTDAELQSWWPDLATVVAELRRTDRPAVADLLVDAVRAVVLRNHCALRSQLGDSAVRAWDAVLAEVFRAFPGSRLAHWFARLTRR